MSSMTVGHEIRPFGSLEMRRDPHAICQYTAQWSGLRSRPCFMGLYLLVSLWLTWDSLTSLALYISVKDFCWYLNDSRRMSASSNVTSWFQVTLQTPCNYQRYDIERDSDSNCMSRVIGSNMGVVACHWILIGRYKKVCEFSLKV